jgi:EAL domain-containing protein (putative c-di-GMP-specific phosphodiesterase class I)
MQLADLAKVIPFPAQPAAAGVPGNVAPILRAIRSHLGMDVAFASQVTAESVTIRHLDAAGNPPFGVGDAFVPEEGYCQRIIDGRLPYLIPDTAAVPEAAALACTSEMPIGAHLSVPIRLKDGRVYGTFCCFSSRPDHSLNQRDLQMMQAFAELAAVQIEAEIVLAGHDEEIAERVGGIVRQDNLAMVYQPIYGLNEDRVLGVEALARFPDGESRPPSEWFADAAGVGLGVELETCALRAALRGLPYLPDDVYLAVNLSPETILAGKVGAALEGVRAGRIVLEVTEHAMVEDYVALQRALKPLRKRARIAIDDAGAGYSGLQHILAIRPDIIKLDMSLTRGIDSDPARSALATALVAFAHDIGSQIVAEGVETAAELEALRILGVECAQGYYLRRPMPISAASQFLTARRFGQESGLEVSSLPPFATIAALTRTGRACETHRAESPGLRGG